MSIYSDSLLFVVTVAVAFCLSPFIIMLAKKKQLNDPVSSRSAHATPTPRAGGLIFIATLAIILIFNWLFPILNLPKNVQIILFFSFLCALLGFLDDRYSLSSSTRLLAQVALVCYPALQLPLIVLFVPAWLQHVLYIVSWIWFINLFNFMDGTDGYATQEAIFILSFLLIAFVQLQAIALITIAACIGFLRVNYPHAKIFMGDVGSYFLGYLLFGLMLYTMTIKHELLLPWLIVSSLFTFDATYTLLKRMLRGEQFLQPHRSHWYQRLYNLGYTHQFIFWVGVMLNSVLFLAALFSLYKHSWILSLVMTLLIFLAPVSFIKYREKLVLRGVAQ